MTKDQSPAKAQGVSEDLCEDEGCPHYGTPHICISRAEAQGVLAIVDRYAALSEPARETFKLGIPLPLFEQQMRELRDEIASLSPAKEARCCSAVSPCSWQRHNGMDSICPTCVAALSGAEAKVVSVKALEWRTLDGKWYAGSYRVHANLDGEPPLYIVSGWHGVGTNPHTSLEAAKAAAQQNHNTYILSCLAAPVPAATDTARPLNSGEVEAARCNYADLIDTLRTNAQMLTKTGILGQRPAIEQAADVIEKLAALSPAPSTPDGWRDIPVTDENVSYVMQYGGRCRECADAMGVCPTSGLPCVADEARSAIRHTLRAVNYGMANGFLPTPPAGGSDA